MYDITRLVPTGVVFPFHIPFILPSFIIYSPTLLHIKPHKLHANICGFVHLTYLEL